MTPICEYPLDNEYADAVRRSGNTGEDLLSFLTAMMRSFDAVQAAKSETDPTRVPLRALQEVALSHLRETSSMVNAAHDMGVTVPELCRHITMGKPTAIEEWDELRWFEIESIMFDQGPWTIRPFAAAANITFTQSRNLISWYDARNHWTWL